VEEEEVELGGTVCEEEACVEVVRVTVFGAEVKA